MWLVAAILDSADAEHCQQTAVYLERVAIRFVIRKLDAGSSLVQRNVQDISGKLHLSVLRMMGQMASELWL